MPANLMTKLIKDFQTDWFPPSLPFSIVVNVFIVENYTILYGTCFVFPKFVSQIADKTNCCPRENHRYLNRTASKHGV